MTEIAMGITATLILLAGAYGLWLLSGRLVARKRHAYIAAGATTVFIGFWFATVQFSSIALRWIPWDDYVFFERIPLFLAIFLLLFLPLRRIRESRQFGIIVIAALFGIYALAEVSGPLWLRLYLPRLDDTHTGTQVLQSTGWTCGPAALAWALREKGVQVSEREATVLSATLPLHGVSDRGMIRAAHRLGFNARMIHNADWQDVLHAPKPALVDVELGMTVAHAVVLLEADEDGVTLGDPLYGRTPLSRTEFLAQWQRVLITVRSSTTTRGTASSSTAMPHDIRRRIPPVGGADYYNAVGTKS